MLNQALIETTKLVQSPNQTIENQTVFDLWVAQSPNGVPKIRTMGSGSDFTAFQDHAGIPCIDMGFGANDKSPVYHYHSNFDSFYWTDNFGDPGWHYHATIAKVWNLLTAKLANEPIISFRAADYATGLSRYLDDITEKAADSNSVNSFSNLATAIHTLTKAAIALDDLASTLSSSLADPSLPTYKRASLMRKAKAVNKKYQFLERQFLYEPGLDSRPWFKHVVFAPGELFLSSRSS